MILFSFNVALGGLEVAAYEFVRETEERLVLFMSQPVLQISPSLKGMGKYKEEMAVSVELDSRELRCHDGRLEQCYSFAVLGRMSTTQRAVLGMFGALAEYLHLPETTQ